MKCLSKINTFLKLSFDDKKRIVAHYYYYFRTQILYKKKFRSLGKQSVIYKPIKITPKYISISRDVYIFYNCRIEGVNAYNNKKFEPLIIIEAGTYIQQNLHLTCALKIHIGKNVGISANVTITDIIHPYEDITVPIEHQDIICKEVTIGDESKIYNNAIILPGVTIGRHCVIGANSVVNISIPDYCVAVGAPARIIKRYDFDMGVWRKTNNKGEFIYDEIQ